MILNMKWVMCFIIMLCSSSSFCQQSWYEIEWQENINEENNTASPEQWISKNVAQFNRGNSGVSLLIKYDINFAVKLQSLISSSKFPYVGFIPDLGDKIGVNFLPGVLGDSIAFLRNGNEESRVQISQNDSLIVCLREGVVEVVVGENYYSFDSFGGSYANRDNSIRMVCNAFLNPIDAFTTIESCPESSLFIMVNGGSSVNNEWKTCEEQAFINIEGLDFVQWTSNNTSCKNCITTYVKTLQDGENILSFYGYNNGCEEDTSFGELSIHKYLDSINSPSKIIICEDDNQTVTINEAQEVTWRAGKNLTISCKTCNSVVVTAERSDILVAKVTTNNGCKKEIGIPVYRKHKPITGYNLVENIDTDNRIVMDLVSNAFIEHQVVWKSDEGKVLEKGLRLKVAAYKKDLIQEVTSEYCGSKEELITLDYPAISPLQFAVNHVDETNVEFIAEPFDCSDCEFLWEIIELRESFNTSVASFTFEDDGEYTIKLTVTDRFGRVEQRLKKIKIYPS
jgi:hypothetical protein